MPAASKIATCCYCGTRAALVLSGKTRHELACATCGAPLHDLKSIPAQKQRAVRDSSPATAPKKSKPYRVKGYDKPRKKPKKRKKLAKKLFAEAFDFLEDIFD